MLYFEKINYKLELLNTKNFYKLHGKFIGIDWSEKN